MKPVLLHVYKPGDREDEQARTKAFLLENAQALDFVVEVIHEATVDDYDYENIVAQAWTGERDLIILEQDLVPTMKMIESLATCSHFACAQAYKINYGPHRDFVHRTDRDTTSRLIREGDEWAHIAGLGLTRFSAQLQREVPAKSWPHSRWNMLDAQISDHLYTLSLPRFKYHGTQDLIAISDIGYSVEARPGDVVTMRGNFLHSDFERLPGRGPYHFHVHWPEVEHNHAYRG